MKNLKFANETIKIFTEKNLNDNSNIIYKNKLIFLNKDFFCQPEEVVFRSLTKVLKLVGQKHYPVRGKKIIQIIELIKKDKFIKRTLGNCLIKRVNKTIIVSKE